MPLLLMAVLESFDCLWSFTPNTIPICLVTQRDCQCTRMV